MGGAADEYGTNAVDLDNYWNGGAPGARKVTSTIFVVNSLRQSTADSPRREAAGGACADPALAAIFRP
jgi:hypothetical protein